VSKVFWDTMLFVYLLEGHSKFAPVVQSLLARSYSRGDMLLTSYLSLGEVLAGMSAGSPAAQTLLTTVGEMGFTFVEFNRGAVDPFQFLRRDVGLRAPDAMHLACAASANADLFLTGDKELVRKKVRVPGIHFIADFENAPF
jgi:uncharacterized protein